MIYLSQLHLNPASRMVQREIANPYQLHRTILQGFGAARQDANVLHRLEDDARTRSLRLLVQATEEPDWTPLLAAGQGDYLTAPPAVKQIDITLPVGRRVRFCLRANPSKKVRRPGHRHSARVELHREEDQLNWLQRQAAQHGFALVTAQVTAGSKTHDLIGNRSGERQRLTLYAVQFDGILQVTDAARFHVAWHKGIGPAKAFGCGLLTLAPA